MAVVEQDIIENSGLVKEIDANDLDMILNVVQKDLYTKPVDSSIRETFSNGVDAVREKEIAISILTGRSDVEDHFVAGAGASTKASAFDKGYYDLKWLDEHNNKVGITYRKSEEDRDLISFEDYGVGLAHKRLRGFFSPGYSSKRLSKKLLGRYGLGSKSPLATNIEFYTLDTWYNGKHSTFMIYDTFYKCITPKSSAVEITYIEGRNQDGEVMKEPIYWESTSRKNGVRISFDVKKHNYDKFIIGIKNQLLYFKNQLTFILEESSGETSEPDMFSEIFLETDTLIISNNRRFTSPHILINNVNYGLLDWDELGINKRFGNIALKANASDVDTTASREVIRYTEKTKAFVLTMVEEAAKEAGKLLSEELDKLENPIEMYVNSFESDAASDVNALVELRKFAGEIRTDIPVDITQYIPEVIRKTLGIKDTIQANKLALFYIENATIIDLDVSGSRITSKIPKSIKDLHMDSAVYYRLNSKVSIRSKEALYLGDCTYVTYTPGTFTIPDKPKQGASTQDKSIYELRLRNYYVRKAMSSMLVDLLKANCTDLDTVSKEDIDKYYVEKKIKGDFAITVNKELKTSSFTVSATTAKEEKNAEIAKLKKEKKVLPYRRLYGRAITEVGLLYHTGDGQIFAKQEECNTSRLPEVTNRVVYSNSHDSVLLHIYAYFLITRSYSKRAPLGDLDFNGDRSFDTSLIMVSDQNKKYFKLIPNSIDVMDLFKGEVSTDNNVLKVASSTEVYRFMTNFRLQMMLKSMPEYFGLVGKSTNATRTAYTQILEDNDMDEARSVIAEVIIYLKELPILDGKYGNDFDIKLYDNIAGYTKKEEDLIKNIVGNLATLTEVQDMDSLSNISDDATRTNLTKYDSHEFTIYDKEFIDKAELSLARHLELFRLVSLSCLITNNSSDNKYVKDAALEDVNNKINEVLINLNK